MLTEGDFIEAGTPIRTSRIRGRAQIPLERQYAAPAAEQEQKAETQAMRAKIVEVDTEDTFSPMNMGQVAGKADHLLVAFHDRSALLAVVGVFEVLGWPVVAQRR